MTTQIKELREMLQGELPDYCLMKRSDVRKGLMSAGLIGMLFGAGAAVGIEHLVKPKGGVKVVGKE